MKLELAPSNVRIALESADRTKAKVNELAEKVNRATPPEKIWTDEAQLLGIDPWHCDLAPAVAAERWKKVRELSDFCDDLEARWHELESEAEAIRKNAAKAHAEALRKGTKAPSTAAKAFEADAALEGCSLVLSETVTELRRARKSYDSLLNDTAFLNEYREAVITEFKAQREKAAEAFKAAAGHINATRRRYGTLVNLTVNHLDAIPEEARYHLPLRGTGWGNADVSTSLNMLQKQFNEDHPLFSGDFFTMPLGEIAEAAEELAEERKATADRRNYLM
ncbi:hypothetical protein [Streptomyces megasporus]|uniref:hypothetical protein n=1 Tax=Streptomyces megasporus TaxID=44060 RepID=UPI0004E21D35|nr:hypothetical protein [Streptomyces megasporus]